MLHKVILFQAATSNLLKYYFLHSSTAVSYTHLHPHCYLLFPTTVDQMFLFRICCTIWFYFGIQEKSSMCHVIHCITQVYLINKLKIQWVEMQVAVV